MQPINLLYIITKLELGGAQKYLLSLTRHLDKSKFRPFLFAAKDGLLLPEALSIDNLTVKRSIWLERPINPVNDLFALIELYYFIKKNKIEFVHTHSSKAGILGRVAAKLAGAKVIVHTVHGWSFNDYQPKIKRLFFIWLERITARFTDKLIVVSEYDKEKGIDNCIGADEKYALIRYGIDYAEFGGKDENLRRELGIKTGELVVGMVSCFKPQKHPQDFIKLASLVKTSSPRTKFLLVGDGALRGEIEILIRKLNLERDVILTGWRKDIPRILSAIDVFVLTSLWEGLPISVIEAMASSKPSVITNTGGVAEMVIEGKMGFLVAPRDMKGMSERLVTLLKDEDLRGRMGKNAKESLNFNFTLANMVTNSQNLYDALLREKALPNGN